MIAKRAGVKTLVLTHLLAQIDQPSVRELIVHEIQKVFDGKVIWGEDLMRLTLAGARVSTIESRTGLTTDAASSALVALLADGRSAALPAAGGLFRTMDARCAGDRVDPAVPGTPAAAAAPGDMGSGWGSTITIAQDTKRLRVEHRSSAATICSRR